MNSVKALPNSSRYAWENLQQRPQTSQQFPERKFPNPFFIRNNPHPTKVRHIKGLLDFPVCSVGTAVMQKRCNHDNEINKRLEIGRNFRNFQKREKFIPTIGLVEINEPWLEELNKLTKQIKFQNISVTTPQPFQRDNVVISNMRCQSRVSTRGISRQSTRNGSRQSVINESNKNFRNFPLKAVQEEYVKCFCLKDKPSYGLQKDLNSISADAAKIKDLDYQYYVISLLSQILEVNAFDEIKEWLANAPVKEKEVVLDMLNAMLESDNDIKEKELEKKSYDIIKIPYEENFLYHESSLNAKEINDFLEKQKQDKDERYTSPRNKPIKNLENNTLLSPRNSLQSRNGLIRDVVPLFENNSAKGLDEIRTLLSTRCGTARSVTSIPVSAKSRSSNTGSLNRSEKKMD